MTTAQAIADHEQLCQENAKAFPDGPWKTEPNRVEFTHAGLQCLLSRNPFMGSWCGYVGVSPAHPLYGKGADYVEADVHGGLTYSNACHGTICHIADDEGEKLHWFGFDCAHGGDLVPGMMGKFPETTALEKALYGTRGGYRTVDYARDETKRLAEMLAEIKKPHTETDASAQAAM